MERASTYGTAATLPPFSCVFKGCSHRRGMRLAVRFRIGGLRADDAICSQRIAMRLPLIPPAELSPEQKSLYDEMRKSIASNFNAFKVEREDGAHR